MLWLRHARRNTVPRRGQALWALLLGVVCLVLVGCGASPSNSGPSTDGYLAGKVTLSDGAAGSHAGILVYLAGTSSQARTNEEGDFVMSGVPAGTYTVMAEKSGYKSLTVARVELSPPTATRESPLRISPVVLSREGAQSAPATAAGAAAVLRGRVALLGAASAADVRVAVEGGASTLTNSSGQFSLFGVTPGALILTFSKDGFREQRISVTAQAGSNLEVAEVILDRIPGAATATATPTPAANPADTRPEGEFLSAASLNGDRVVTGRVEIFGADGQPVTNFTDIVVSLDNSDVGTTPNEEGRFRIERLPAGRYKVVVADAAGQVQSATADLRVQKLAEVLLTLGRADAAGTKPGRVTGRVVLLDAQNQTTPAPAGVSVALAGTQLLAVTGADGTFALNDVPAGTYEVVASKDEYEAAEPPEVTVESGASVESADVVLQARVDYPRVVATTPVDGASNVVVGEVLPVRVRFSRAMDVSAVKGAVTVTPDANVAVLMGKGDSPDTDEQNLLLLFDNSDFSKPIRYGQSYRVAISTAAVDTNGVPLKETFEFSFKTGNAGVLRTSPTDGTELRGTGAAYQPITIYFNTRLKEDTVNDRTIRVRPRTGNETQVDVRSDGQTGWSIVDVRAPMLDPGEYTFTVESGVRAADGSRLSNTPYNFRVSIPRQRPSTRAPRVVR